MKTNSSGAMKKLLMTATLALWFQFVFAQQEGDNLIKWDFKFEHKNLKAGDEVPIICSANIQKDWLLFVSDYDPRWGIKSIEFEFSENGTFGVIKPVLPMLRAHQHECSQDGQFQNIAEKITFRSLLRIEENKFEVSGTVRGQLYHQKTGQYVLFQKQFVIQ
jgi:thiol:disulfide interchange protein DsbD